MTTFLLARRSILTPGVVSSGMMSWTDSKTALFCAVTAGILDGTFGYL